MYNDWSHQEKREKAKLYNVFVLQERVETCLRGKGVTGREGTITDFQGRRRTVFRGR